MAQGGGSDASLEGGRVGGGDPGAGVGPREGDLEPCEAVAGLGGSGNHPSPDIGFEAFEVWGVGWVKTRTRLEARVFGG